MSDGGNPDEEVSRLLARVRAGDAEAHEKLFDAVYQQLHRIASRQMRSERPDHSLEVSGLVHEAYLRMHPFIPTADSRKTFLFIAARAMRRILVDHARKRNAEKRTAPGSRQLLDSLLDCYEAGAGGAILDLDEALEKLNRDAPRQREIVELKFFGGRTIPEIASQLSVSEATVQSDWRLARAKLYRWLRPDSVGRDKP